MTHSRLCKRDHDVMAKWIDDLMKLDGELPPDGADILPHTPIHKTKLKKKQEEEAAEEEEEDSGSEEGDEEGVKPQAPSGSEVPSLASTGSGAGPRSGKLLWN